MSEKSPGAVLWQVTMSLDGYIAGPGDDLSWVFDHVDPHDPGAAGVPGRIGAVVAGRHSFDVGARDDRDVFDGSWSGPQFLLTRRPVDVPSAVTVRSGDVGPVIAEALRAAVGQDVGIIGADIARQCLEANLVDEVIVHVAPVLLGDGIRFQGAIGRHDLTLVDVTRHREVATLTYRNRKEFR